ncbi:MAG: nitroreductase family protein [Gammaproteobacteria bacterium]|nr:nitroreductase family protein [Gammaproteobacteria bacterium]
MKPTDLVVSDFRRPDHPIESILVDRWSPRAMSAEPIDLAQLNRLFEAARWAPSSYNAQPWVLIYARRDTPAWAPLFNTLVEFNQSWAKDAAALIVIVAKTVDGDGNRTRTHSFDCGAAWQNLALQGSRMGLVVHGMQGFDYDAAAKVMGVPDGYEPEAMIAVGHPGEIDALGEKMAGREKPSERKPISEFVSEGTFSIG